MAQSTGRNFFLFLFPSSGIPESFYLRNEKKKIFHLHNLTTQFEMPDSSIPETQWWKWVYLVLFWNMLLSMHGIFEAPPMSCPVFCPTIIFHSWKNGAFFFLCCFTHTESWLFFMIMLWSQNVSLDFCFRHVIPWDLSRLRFRLLQRMNTFDNREN